ncbi:CAF17-like 4Fe-4S cluster assembly/insertion protein YgfZ [Devriesea agamarum]|uniref:CAF17-like 4Fe-4S cluster assembly/insertion protein YgfZ n=1 Tax=Devriesea agamarum TaxID=472569 RepID=UPI00071CD93B|nr:glycine cleavage T C-terminal barrel domain-containing protein [Devriesea agamarum]
MTVPPPPREPSRLAQLPGAVLSTGLDQGVAAHYGASLREQRRMETGRAVVDLSHLDILEIAGADRLTWLHAITSQHLVGCVPGNSTELLVLSPQGRIEHAAAVIVGETSLMLVVDPGRSGPLLEFFDRMRFAARVQITVRDDLAAVGSQVPWPKLSLHSQPECSQLADNSSAQTVHAPVAVWTDPWPGISDGGIAYGPEPEDASAWHLSLLPRSAWVDAIGPAWHRADGLAGLLAAEARRIAAHRPRFLYEVDDRSIPHELDWLRTAVHTAKGCYRGQETVAKVLNLGQPPRRLVMLHLDGGQETLPVHGDAVAFSGRAIGHVTSAAVHADLGPIALALVRRAVPVDAPLTVQALAGDNATVLDATQEPIVLPRDHGQRPPTAKL